MGTCNCNCVGSNIASAGNGVSGCLPKVYTPKATGTLVERDIRDRFADIINVKDYGAKGTGDIDDKAAIQAAFDAASSGQTVFFPAGKYVVASQIIISNDVSMHGDSCASVEIDCQYAGIQFKNTKTLTDVSISGITFSGTGTNTCFSAGDSGYGFHRVSFSKCKFNTFLTAVETRYTIFVSFSDTYFNQNGTGVAFRHDRAPVGSSYKTYHNVNSLKNCYFNKNNVGVLFRPEAVGGGLLIDSTAFDYNTKAINASSPIEIINGYFERNGIAIDMDNEDRTYQGASLTLNRVYLLGSPTPIGEGGTAYTGFKLENVRCDVTASITFADYFQNSFYLTNGSTFVNTGTSQIVQRSIFYADESSSFYEIMTSTGQYRVYEIEDVDTTPQAVSNMSFSYDAYTVRILTPNGTKITFFLSIGSAEGFVRCSAFGVNSGNVTTDSYNTFTISAYPDVDNYDVENKYTFSIDNNGILYISSNHQILGTTKLALRSFDRKPDMFAVIADPEEL